MRAPDQRRRILLTCIAALMLSLFARQPDAMAEEKWTELESLAGLQSRFNDDKDSTRIILLLSPT